MKFKFDPNQEFQLEAIKAVVDVFEGQDKSSSNKKVSSNELLGIYSNNLSLSDNEIFSNVERIQEANEIKSEDNIPELDFSIEMETGTGKTYVYLRTIFELNKKYGWKKFIIIVPSVAIREGVIKTLQITKQHFKDLYDNEPYRFYEYQSKNISQVKHFASSSNVEIMVMTMGAFNKDANVLYSERDQMQGEQPMSYIQKVNPILILDEPQNMEGEATKEKLKEFNSLLKLRYSATHKNPYNLLSRLSPYDAYQLGLVKKIEVFSVLEDDSNIVTAFVNLLDVAPSKNTLKAKVEVITKDAKGNQKKKAITVKQGDDLSVKANNALYEGYIVEAMTANAPDFGSIGSIRFRNNISLKIGDATGGNREEIMRNQITETIKLHFEKKLKLKEFGIKVLSLFFVDKVDSYVSEDGYIRKIFIEEFNKLKVDYKLGNIDHETAHKGYFAMKKNKYLESNSSIEKNKEAYELIMKDKERLLSFDEPTEFIFSHSALKEGWDNPNIFNICTLKTTHSTVRKRQEIGRGMRLCVNQNGERVFLNQLNLLSVIANESYADYVTQLQSEFVEDGIYRETPIPHNAKKRKLVRTRKGFKKDENFRMIWERISKKTRYFVKVDSEGLIKRCAKRVQNISISKPQLRIERAAVDIAETGIEAMVIGSQEEDIKQNKKLIDCVELIKDETKLTKKTVSQILFIANNTKALFNNPVKFSFEASKIIKEELVKDYIEQISYEILPDHYEADQFENITSYQDSIQPVHRSIYDAIVYDSEVEKKFAVELDKDERIKLFIKLPDWFKVDTPVGQYNPDWGIVTAKRDLKGKESKEKVYFVIETKGDVSNLRPTEQAKIDSAKKHFEVIGVKYKEAENYGQFKEEYLTT